MKNYVITIARGFGSGGKDIGERLSKALGIPCYERQILTMASDQSGIDESVFVETDEKLRGKYIANFLRKIPVTGVVEAWDPGRNHSKSCKNRKLYYHWKMCRLRSS